MDINSKVWMLAWSLTVARMLGMFIAMPYFGAKNLPGLARNGIVVTLSLVAVPIVMDQVGNAPYSVGLVAALFVKEVVLGFMMGYFFSIPFWAASAAGVFIDMQRGVFNGQLFSPTTGDATSPLGDLLSRIYLVLLFSSGGFLLMYEVMLNSFNIWPIDSFTPHFNMEATEFILQQFDLMMYMMLLIAGPIIIVMFIIELGGAIIGRDIPELNVFLLIMPIKSGIALFLLVIYIAFVVYYLKNTFLDFGTTFNILDTLLNE